MKETLSVQGLRLQLYFTHIFLVPLLSFILSFPAPLQGTLCILYHLQPTPEASLTFSHYSCWQSEKSICIISISKFKNKCMCRWIIAFVNWVENANGRTACALLHSTFPVQTLTSCCSCPTELSSVSFYRMCTYVVCVLLYFAVFCVLWIGVS